MTPEALLALIQVLLQKPAFEVASLISEPGATTTKAGQRAPAQAVLLSGGTGDGAAP